MKYSKNSITKNAVFGIISWFIPLVLSFAATPLILNKLGKKEFGIYLLVLDFVSYSFAFNIGRSVTKFIAYYEAIKDRKKVNEVISIAIIINSLLVLAAFLLMTIWADWFVDNILQVEPEFHIQAVHSFYIADRCRAKSPKVVGAG